MGLTKTALKHTKLDYLSMYFSKGGNSFQNIFLGLWTCMVCQKNIPRNFFKVIHVVTQGTNRTASFTPPNLTKIKAVKGGMKMQDDPAFLMVSFFSGIGRPPPKKKSSLI